MRQPSFVSILILALAGFLPANPIHAQFDQLFDIEDLITWETSVFPGRIGLGGQAYAVFDASLTGDWKIYALESSLPPLDSVLVRPYGVTIEWTSLPEGFGPFGAVRQRTPETDYDVNFDMTLKFFHEEARFVSGIESLEQVGDGSFSLEANVRFQICSDERGMCLRPTTVPLTVDLMIDSSCIGEGCFATTAMLTGLVGDQKQDTSSPSLISASTDFEAFRESGFWSFLLLAIGAGLASLLTPCVFPMVPLTVSYFTKHSNNRAEAVRMASVFGGSIIVMFTALGVIAAVLLGAAGAQRIAANPWVNLFITIVLVGFALSLLGMYELRLPTGLVNFFNRKGEETSGWVGVLFMGLTLTLVSFSCTAPFVGGLLAAAAGGTWLYPLVGMIVYSATFALPFVLFALFPNALNALPRSGSWMNSVKVVLGFVELAAAIKFLSNADLIWGWGLISRPLGIAFIVVVFFLTGFYLLGKLRLPHEDPVESVGAGRVLASIVFFVSALYMVPGLLGAPLNRLDAYLPPRQGTDVSILSLMQFSGGLVSLADEEAWHVDDIEGAFTEASEVGLPVLIDFTGYTCTNCREMESNVFPRKPVADRFETDFVLLRLYTDGLERGDEFNRYQLRLTGTVALPTYAIVHPFDQAVLARRSGMMDADEFAAFLDAGTASFNRLERQNPSSVVDTASG